MKLIPVSSSWIAGLIATLSATALLPTAAHSQNAASLPAYHAQEQVSGVLRSRREDQMASLMKLWEQGFKRHHPSVQFDDTLKGSASGMYGIEMRTADMAVMGRPINPFERYGTYERGWAYPIAIQVATGAARDPRKSPAVAIFVNKDNPLTQLTMQQLDGVFGARRTGGWVALRWDENAARGSEQDIRTWGQLGISGALANQPIHVYGPPNRGAGEVTFFESRVFGGARIWNEDLREYPDPATLMSELSRDPQGIGYGALGDATPGVKVLALAPKDSQTFVPLTAQTVGNRTYPLYTAVYIYYTIDLPNGELSETHGDPRVKEFLRYVLSKEGQELVARDGSYLPLTAAVAQEQVQKIESKEVPPEHAVLD